MLPESYNYLKSYHMKPQSEQPVLAFNYCVRPLIKQGTSYRISIPNPIL